MNTVDKSYHALIPGRIFLGGAADIEAMAEREALDLVVDLREESSGCASSRPALDWIRIPLADNTEELEASLFGDAIQTVVTAYRNGDIVGFHCGGGRGRTGTVAAGVLLELGLASEVDEAIAAATAIRPVLSVKSMQRAALLQLYPSAGRTPS